VIKPVISDQVISNQATSDQVIPMRVRDETISGLHGAPKARTYQSLGQRPRESFANIRQGLKARFIMGKPGFQPLTWHRSKDLGRWPRLEIGRAFGPLHRFVSS
jgi:hypothetical protein